MPRGFVGDKVHMEGKEKQRVDRPLASTKQSPWDPITTWRFVHRQHQGSLPGLPPLVENLVEKEAQVRSSSLNLEEILHHSHDIRRAGEALRYIEQMNGTVEQRNGTAGSPVPWFPSLIEAQDAQRNFLSNKGAAIEFPFREEDLLMNIECVLRSILHQVTKGMVTRPEIDVVINGETGRGLSVYPTLHGVHVRDQVMDSKTTWTEGHTAMCQQKELASRVVREAGIALLTKHEIETSMSVQYVDGDALAMGVSGQLVAGVFDELEAVLRQRVAMEPGRESTPVTLEGYPIRPPGTGFMYYVNEMAREPPGKLKLKQSLGTTGRDMALACKELWSKMKEGDRKKWLELSEKDADRHRIETVEWLEREARYREEAAKRLTKRLTSDFVRGINDGGDDSSRSLLPGLVECVTGTLWESLSKWIEAKLEETVALIETNVVRPRYNQAVDLYKYADIDRLGRYYSIFEGQTSLVFNQDSVSDMIVDDHLGMVNRIQFTARQADLLGNAVTPKAVTKLEPRLTASLSLYRRSDGSMAALFVDRSADLPYDKHEDSIVDWIAFGGDSYGSPTNPHASFIKVWTGLNNEFARDVMFTANLELGERMEEHEEPGAGTVIEGSEQHTYAWPPQVATIKVTDIHPDEQASGDPSGPALHEIMALAHINWQ